MLSDSNRPVFFNARQLRQPSTQPTLLSTIPKQYCSIRGGLEMFC